MEEELKEMDFGRKYRIGNFECWKVTRALSRREVESLRDQAGVPNDVRKHLRRGGLPFLNVQSVSGGWSVSFVIGTMMYRYIELMVMSGDDGKRSLVNLFTMMYADTTVMGDQEYWKAKAEALQAFMDRQKAREVSDEEDKRELDSLRTEEEARAAIMEMGEDLKRHGDGKE